MFRFDEDRRAQSALRRRLFGAIKPALAKLARAARGESEFTSDHELRACIALTRLASLLIGTPIRLSADQSPPSPIHPDVPPEEAERLISAMEAEQLQ